MTNTINSQRFYTNFTQSATQQSTQKRPEFRAFTDDVFYVSPDYEFDKQRVPSSYDANIEHSTNSVLMEKLSNKVYQKSQSILGEVSQRRYERAVSSLAAKMQELMQTLSKNSLSYEWADTLYGHFLGTQSPETMSYDEIDDYTIKLNGKTELRTSRVQESKNKVMEALANKSSSVMSEVTKLKKNLINLAIHAKQMPAAVTQFFATFESAFSESEMQAIIDNIATIQAYGEYNAHHIKLADGSTISWEQDTHEQINIFIDGVDINTALENADKLLTEMENFKTLLEMLENSKNSGFYQNAIKENSQENNKNPNVNFNERFNASNQNFKTNSTDNLLKALLNDIANDEKSTNLSV